MDEVIINSKSIIKFLASVEFWVVILLTAGTFIFYEIIPWAIGIALFFWPIRFLANGRISLRTPADGSVLLLLCIILIHWFFSPFPEVNHINMYRLILGILVYYAIVNYGTSRGRLTSLMAGIVLAGFALAVFALISVQWLRISKFPWMPLLGDQLSRIIVADPVHPNVMAGNIAILLPCALSLLIFAWVDLTNIQRLLILGAALFMGAIILLTQSRSGILSLLVLATLLISLRWRYAWLGFLSAFFLLAIGILFFIDEPLVNIIIGGNVALGWAERMDIWTRAIYMIQDHPLIGIGIGSFQYVFDSFYPSLHYASGQIVHAHNLLLQIAIDIGIPGLITWLATWLALTVAAWGLYLQGRKQGDNLFSALGGGLFVTQVVILFGGLLDAVTWGTIRSAPLVWVLWGIIAAAINFRSRTIPARIFPAMGEFVEYQSPVGS